MKKFELIFGEVMVAITSTEVAMMGGTAPIVTWNGETWVEFTEWVNKSFSPHMKLGDAWMGADRIRARILGNFTPKCAAALKSCGIIDWELFADYVYDDGGGRPQAESLYLGIPYVQSI